MTSTPNNITRNNITPEQHNRDSLAYYRKCCATFIAAEASYISYTEQFIIQRDRYTAAYEEMEEAFNLLSDARDKMPIVQLHNIRGD